MLRKRRSHTEYGWIIGDRLVAYWPLDQAPPPGWTRSSAAWPCIVRICDGTEDGERPPVIGYSYSALPHGADPTASSTI